MLPTIVDVLCQPQLSDAAAYYRRVVVELRATAELADAPSFRTTLLTLATQFDRLAEYAEHRRQREVAG